MQRTISFIASIPRFSALALLSMLITSHVTAESAAPALIWKQLPSLPDKEGFAYPFAGVHGQALIVAGGANFPDKRPWESGTKVWYDSVYVLEAGVRTWKTGIKLPHPIGYGVSISTENGIVCIGGSDKDRHFSEVFLLKWDAEKSRLLTTTLPPLPVPCANSCGALLGHTIYVAGGLKEPDATQALHSFWSLDLNNLQAGWKIETPWPGKGCMLATAATADGVFYLFSGAALKQDTDGKITREWLEDAYQYTPGQGWKTLPTLPRPAIAAPTPAPVTQDGRILILGGDDGSQVSVPPSEHKGFPRDVLAYDPATNSWFKHGDMPFSLVTTPTVLWLDQVVIPGGEQRPGIRSTEVWSTLLKTE